MEKDYKIIDVTRDQMSTDIERQLARLKPMPGEVLALKGNTLDGFCYLPFLVIFNPENQVDGYHQMMLSILKRLRIDEEIYSQSNKAVEIDDIDCLNIDIEEGRLTPTEAYHAFLTHELPDHYTGMLADTEDCEGEEWKEKTRKIPKYTEWCSKVSDAMVEEKRFLPHYTVEKGKPVCKVLEGTRTETLRISNN